MANDLVTETLRLALQRSIRIAANSGVKHILPETLFLSIIADSTSQATMALRKLGITTHSATTALPANSYPRQERDDVSFSPEVGDLLNKAVILARRQGYKCAATFHIATIIINDPPDTMRTYLNESKATPEKIAIALNDPQPEN